MKSLFTIVCILSGILCLTASPFAQQTSCIALYSKADELCKQGRWSDAAQIGRQALRKARMSGSVYDLISIKSLTLLGHLQRDQGKLGEAAIFCGKARTETESQFGPNHPNTIKSLIRLADLAERQSKDERAKGLYYRAIQTSNKSGRTVDIAVAPALTGLAGLYKDEGHSTKAEQLYKQALEIYETLRKYRPYLDSKIARIHTNLAAICRDRGDYGRASQEDRLALAKYESMEGFGSVNVADTRVSLADTYISWRKPARAERQYRKALAIYQKLGGTNDIKAAITLKRLGDLYLGRGNFPKAERSYSKAVAVLKKCSPTCSATLASALKALADLRMQRGDHAKAASLYTSLLAILR